MADSPPLLEKFRLAFREHPRRAFREWYVFQEHLRDHDQEAGNGELAAMLSEDLWVLSSELVFDSDDDRARWFHDFAVFLGSRGPAANLMRALEAFDVPFAIWNPGLDSGAYSRALHNRANALVSLGTTTDELDQAIAGFEEALRYRTMESNSIARGASLHSLGIALRRRAELEPAPQRRLEILDRSESVFAEALTIRTFGEQPLGFAISSFQRALTLAEQLKLGRLDRLGETSRSFRDAETAYVSLGKSGEAEVVRVQADRIREG